MSRMLLRRLLAIVLLTPCLSAVGFMYAQWAGRTYSDDRSMPVWQWLLTAYRLQLAKNLRGEWGQVWSQIPLNRFLNASLQLLGVGLLVVVIVGPLLGLLAVNWRRRRIRPLAVGIFSLASALPGFFVTTLVVLLVVYGRRLGWFSSGRGYLIPVQGTGFDKHLILPVLALVFRPITTAAALTATMLEQELHQEYVLAAQGRGLRWSAIVWRHALPNIRSNLLVVLGLGGQAIVGGLILVEPLLDWRGAGWLMSQVFIAAPLGTESPYYLNSDVLTVLLPLFGATILLLDALVQLLSHYADPRLREVGLLEEVLR